MIQKVYSRDPLICPKCNGKMKVIAFTMACGLQYPDLDNHTAAVRPLCRCR
ncbi:MAG: hypothetical protein ACQESO_04565 [Bacillota bacterium]